MRILRHGAGPRPRPGIRPRALALAVAVVVLLLVSSLPAHLSAGSAPPPPGTRAMAPSKVVGLGPNPDRVRGFHPSGFQVDPGALYTAEPAPMGIADFGVNGSATGYTYRTPAFWGDARISSLATYTNVVGSQQQVSFQLNVVLVLTSGPNSYSFWIQDVALFNSSNHQVLFIDNIWNFSSAGASVLSSSVSGNGTVDPSGYYWDQASSLLPGSTATLTLPSEVGFLVRAITTHGLPGVLFEYNDGFGWVTYDNVSFSFTSGYTNNGFVVDGTSYNPAGLYDDAELILGGPGGGANTQDNASKVRLALLYWNGHNYQHVTNAYNHGSDTAEGITNAVARGYYARTNGSVYGSLTNGSGNLGLAYSRSLIGLLNVSLPFSQGNLSVNGSNEGRFSGGEMNLTIGPGNYSVSVYRNGSLYATKSVVIGRGQYVPLSFGSVRTFNVSFRESGLPAGHSWAVRVGGATNTSPASSLGFQLPNGTWPYSVAVPSGYRAVPSSGFARVNGANLTVSVLIQPVTYAVVFTETGLPFGMLWSVNLNGTLQGTTNGTTTFSEQNGSYPFSVGLISGFQPIPGSGTVAVVGAGRIVTVTYALVEYPVLFSETGLPAGTYWGFSFNGGNYTTNQTSLAVVAPNGSFAFALFPLIAYRPIPASGTIQVSGSAVQETIAWTLVTYTLTVNEAGLASGTSWTLSVDGVTHVEFGSVATFAVTNGSHTLRYFGVLGFYPVPASAFVNIHGGPLSVSVSYQPYTFPVTFTETGLPAGTSWTVSLLDGSVTVNQTGTSPVLSFAAPNGTWTFRVSVAGNYLPTPATGQGRTSGQGSNVTIAFNSGEGRIIGSVAPPSAQLWINGTAVNLSGGSFNVTLPPGSYALRVTAPGYLPWYRNVTVGPGGDTRISITLNATSSSKSGGLLSTGVLPLLVIGAIALAGLLVAGALWRRRDPPPPNAPHARTGTSR